MKKLFCAISTLGLISSFLVSPAFANENTDIPEGKVNQILEESGYDIETLEEMEFTDKQEIATAILKDPSLVESSNTLLTIDNISTLEYFTNTEDSELIQEGYGEEEINNIRDKIDYIDNLSKNEVKDKYNVSSSEYKMIKKALETNPEYEVNDDSGEKTVTTSGSIATSKMSFGMTKVNNSTSKAPSYNITVTYNWKSPYFVDSFSDNIGIAWGGGLNSKNISSTAKYYAGNWYTGKYNSLKYTKSWSKSETPNKGIVFSTAQARAVATQQNKTGTIKATLYQTKFKGYDTKVISQFAHKIVTVSNITISGTPSITIGTGFDKSAQKASTIKY